MTEEMIKEYYTILALLTNNEHLLESGRMDFSETESARRLSLQE
jgi:hypothetical protein